MTRIPMKGDATFDRRKLGEAMDEALPRMLRDCLRYRQADAEAGEGTAGWDKPLAEIEALCRRAGIDPAPIRAEFEDGELNE